MSSKLPQIKFLKKSMPEILAGTKTMEARPRSPRWINNFYEGQLVELTYGARFKAPIVFATARIEQIAVKPFADATEEDVKRFGGGWHEKGITAFVAEHERWYADEFAKDYPVVWIYFKLVME
jgi:hypothetical protein